VTFFFSEVSTETFSVFAGDGLAAVFIDLIFLVESSFCSLFATVSGFVLFISFCWTSVLFSFCRESFSFILFSSLAVLFEAFTSLRLFSP